MAIKLLRIDGQAYFELKLIAAEINSKGIRPFLEDLFTHILTHEDVITDLLLIDPAKTGVEKSIGVDLSTTQSHQLNILAATKKTSLSNLLESICTGLANEHRANGRVWIDDTPAKALPIRMRK